MNIYSCIAYDVHVGHQRNKEVQASTLDIETAATIATILHGLATPSRVRIIAALEAGPMNVGAIVAAIGMEQSAVSHQLRHLRDLGFVAAERHGRTVVYRLFDDHIVDLITQALAHAEHLALSAEAPPTVHHGK